MFCVIKKKKDIYIFYLKQTVLTVDFSIPTLQLPPEPSGKSWENR